MDGTVKGAMKAGYRQRYQILCRVRVMVRVSVGVWRQSVGTMSEAENCEGGSTSQCGGKGCCKQDSDSIAFTHHTMDPTTNGGRGIHLT